MRVLGTIVKLQVQVVSLKVGEPPFKRYDPAGIREVVSLELSAVGVRGRTIDGTYLDDVHNRTHPKTKNRAGSNGISIGFDSHYARMRSRFGEHLTDGIAGENILVRLTGTSEQFVESDFSDGVTVRRADGGLVVLSSVIVAPPCAEFSRWALKFPEDARPDRTVTKALQFLHQGTRGFYCSFKGPVTSIALGDEILIP